MILCLVDLDICDKVLSPCQTEAFLTIQSLFIHLFFFLHFSCLQFATMSDSILSRRKLARPQFWYQFSSLISWRWRRRPAYLMPNLLHLLLDIHGAVRLALELYTPGWCSLCMLPASHFARWSSNMCEYMHPGDFPSTTWGLEYVLLFLRSIAPIRLLSCS